LELRRFDQVKEFYEWAEPFLLTREADHCLMLGICTEFMRHGAAAGEQPYLALVTQGNAVLAAAVRTPPHGPVLSHVLTPEALPLLVSDALAEYGMLPAVLGPVPISEAFAQRWQQLSGHSYRLQMALRIYRLDAVRPAARAAGHLRRATQADRQLLTAWLAGFQADIGETANPSGIKATLERFLTLDTRGLYLWEDGQPVSMAGYCGPTPNGCRISTVYTPPEHRRRGYASACVAALSQLLLDSGRRFCFLFTDLSNPTSNHIYQEVGYEPVCDAELYAFVTAEAGAE